MYKAGLILHQGYDAKKVTQNEHKIPIFNSVFPVGSGIENLFLYSA